MSFVAATRAGVAFIWGAGARPPDATMVWMLGVSRPVKVLQTSALTDSGLETADGNLVL